MVGTGIAAVTNKLHATNHLANSEETEDLSSNNGDESQLSWVLYVVSDGIDNVGWFGGLSGLGGC